MSAKILVVDDEQFIVEAISQHLEQSGYDVAAFMDPTDAITAIQREKFDLVLTDLRMPNVSGMDITRSVAETKRDTRVIILTGYATLDSAIESVQLKVYAYLNKPFDLRQLSQIVERALAEQQMTRENEALNERIAKMLADMTTLHEVTRLLYDTQDWDLALEFVMDTLSLGLGFQRSCLLTRSENGDYHLVKTNIPDSSPLKGVVEDFDWNSLDGKIPVDETSLVLLTGRNEALVKNLSHKDEPLTGIMFTPIRFRESHLGFLVALLDSEQADITADQQQLLEVLSTQISPQVFQLGGAIAMGEPDHHAYIRNSLTFLAKEIEQGLEDEESLGISLVRFLTPRKLATLDDMDQFHKDIHALIRKHEPGCRAYWPSVDTALLIFPGCNKVQSDISVIGIEDDFKREEQERLVEPGLVDVQHVSLVWPEDTSNAKSTVGALWGKLLRQVHDSTAKILDSKSSNG